MDKRQVERRLERAFRSAPLSYGTGRVRERRKPFELAQTILPAGKPQSYRDCRHGDVLEELERLGVATRRLLSLAWEGFGPVSRVAGLDLVGDGPQRYLCWWDEDDSYRAVAAVFPWWDGVAVSRTVSRVICRARDGFGLELFGRLPDETINRSPDLVSASVLARAYLGVMRVWDRWGREPWVNLAELHFGRIVEPNHLQWCLDQLELVLGSAENFRQELAARAAENAAMPEQARVGLVEEWFRTTYEENDAGVSSEAISR